MLLSPDKKDEIILQKSCNMLTFTMQAFRMQQETREGLSFLVPDGGGDGSSHELVHMQASHAETVLELQKTRNLLLLEHKITKDLQVHRLLIELKHDKAQQILRSKFPLQGRVEHDQPEGGEREGGEQEAGGRERQTSIKKSSADQHLTR